jgi:hypothetical protein
LGDTAALITVEVFAFARWAIEGERVVLAERAAARSCNNSAHYVAEGMHCVWGKTPLVFVRRLSAFKNTLCFLPQIDEQRNIMRRIVAGQS